jgi:virginiamycin B lyase
MRCSYKILLSMAAAILAVPLAHSAAVSGTLKGPDGAPFKGGFVQAQNTKTRITINVLSDKDGRYSFVDLPAGEYNVRIRAVGYRSDSHSGVQLSASQKTSFDFNLQAAPVRWSDLSFYQGDTLFPAGKGKDLIEKNCLECHAFQTKMAGVSRDMDGWTKAVAFMKDVMGYRLTQVSDDDAKTIASYLDSVFGQESKLPRDVREMPDYKNVMHAPFTDEAMKIVYVSYELPGPNRMPFSAAPDGKGSVWIPYFSLSDSIGKLDPNTGDVQEFRVPYQGSATIHSAVAAPDGNVWLAEQESDRIGKWDPATKQITEYQDAMPPNPDGKTRRGSKHTVRIDGQGNVWSTGSPLSKYVRETGKFVHFADVPSAYGIALAKDGTAWFAEFGSTGKIGKVDPDTGKVTKYTVPTPDAWPRRIQVADDGTIWFAEFGESPATLTQTGKIAHFDPKTETFKEYTLPGKSASPYAFNFDSKGHMWYSNMHEDLVGCLDPKTGQVVEYPLPFSENTMREFFLDKDGRMWWGSPSNNKVGYFYLTN